MLKKIFFLVFIFALTQDMFPQQNKMNLSFGKYDSVVVSNYYGDINEIEPIGIENKSPSISRTISSEDAKALNNALHKKESYGSSQAVTPIYDIEISYYRKGNKVDKVLISLWTNNLFASYPLKIQRQGDCLCKGNGGYCCSKGGISIDFKKYLILLLKKYTIPVEDDYTID